MSISIPENEECMEMWLCESRSCMLRIGQLYRFTPDPTCESCMEMKREHDDAYGVDASPKTGSTTS
jgi:hypothetical protein